MQNQNLNRYELGDIVDQPQKTKEVLEELTLQLEDLTKPNADDKKYDVDIELTTGHKMSLKEYRVRRTGDCFSFTYDKPFDEVIIPVVKIVYLVKKEPAEK